jgi:hypothetical protein
MITAIKYNEDDFYSNKYYSKVGGINLSELNFLEAEFIKLLNYELYIDNDTFFKYKKYLKQYEY